MEESSREVALCFHEFLVPGKISVTPAKSLSTSQDLALAYSPGVATPCAGIHANPQNAYEYTTKDSSVAVISNGTAVLGLGDIDALADKPVAEGKDVLFKKFVGVDALSIEISEKDPQKLVDIIAALEPIFGSINLEDVKAPGCSYIERELRKCCKVPVFHNDQHGTIIITAVAILNALCSIDRDIEKTTLVCSDAGATAIACLNQLLALGLKHENVVACDPKGVIYKAREGRDRIDESKKLYAIEGNGQRVLAGAVKGKDIFLGLSGASLLTPEMLNTVNAKPTMLTMANPNPEILPLLVKETRDDVIIGAGRSGFPNQVNDILCFPFISRGVLDIDATTINEEMKLACVYALADSVTEEISEEVIAAYGREFEFGTDYLIPTPFDRRLISHVATVTAKAAIKGGVATRPITDLAVYAAKLEVTQR